MVILTEAALTDMLVQLRQHLRSILTTFAFGAALRTAFLISDMVMSGNLIGGGYWYPSMSERSAWTLGGKKDCRGTLAYLYDINKADTDRWQCGRGPRRCGTSSSNIETRQTNGTICGQKATVCGYQTGTL